MVMSFTRGEGHGKDVEWGDVVLSAFCHVQNITDVQNIMKTPDDFIHLELHKGQNFNLSSEVSRTST